MKIEGEGGAAPHYDALANVLYCVYVLQNPDGSMQRAAITQSALSKERRELRAAQREAEMDNVPRDIGKTWIDPVPGGTGTGGTCTSYICRYKIVRVHL